MEFAFGALVGFGLGAIIGGGLSILRGRQVNRAVDRRLELMRQSPPAIPFPVQPEPQLRKIHSKTMWDS